MGALLLAGCGDDAGEEGGETACVSGSRGESLPEDEIFEAEVRYETEHLEVAQLFPDPLCAGTLRMLDEHVEYVEHELGVCSGARIPFYIIRSQDTPPPGWCSDLQTTNCHRNGNVFAQLQAAGHELVHAVTIRSRGRSYWNEHIAYAYDGMNVAYHEVLHAGDAWPLPWLNGNGHLTRWLIDRHGGPAFMDLFDATAPGVGQAEFEAAFRTVYGETFATALDEYAETAPAVYPGDHECYVPPGVSEVAWQGDLWQHEVRIDCAEETAFTWDNTIEHISTRVPLSIATPGAYRFVANHPDAELYIRPCLKAPLASFDDSLIVKFDGPSLIGTQGTAELIAGPYLLDVVVPLGDPVTVRLQGYPAIGSQWIP